MTEKTKLEEKAEEFEKFLRDRLSEDDYKTFWILHKEIIAFIFENIAINIHERLNLGNK